MTIDMRQLVEDLFDAWSSGDAERIRPFFHPDARLWDSVNGEFRGWEQIRSLYEASLERWGDLRTWPTRFWGDGTGRCIAFTWTMTGEVLHDLWGPDARGQEARIEGMSYIEVDDDGQIVEEVEFFDRAGPLTSLGVASHLVIDGVTNHG